MNISEHKRDYNVTKPEMEKNL